MAGGAGTRLWPISRAERPKQFQSFVGPETLLQHMVSLATEVVPLERVFIMATPQFSQTIQEQLPELPSQNILFEPARRDNGPAIMLGMLQVSKLDPQATVAILWSDHLIQSRASFAITLNAAFMAAEATPQAMVTVGANPTFPNTALGYIQMGKEVAQYADVPVFTVRKFIEKPELKVAQAMVSGWEYLWNIGYKVLNVQMFIETFREVQPELRETFDALQKAESQAVITELYEKFPKLSIEYIYTPFVKELLVVPADMGWSDIGDWKTLHEVLAEDHPENLALRGQVISHHSRGSLAFSKTKPIVLLGVEDIVVVEEDDVILVMNREQAQDIKQLNALLETANPELL